MFKPMPEFLQPKYGADEPGLTRSQLEGQTDNSARFLTYLLDNNVKIDYFYNIFPEDNQQLIFGLVKTFIENNELDNSERNFFISILGRGCPDLKEACRLIIETLRDAVSVCNDKETYFLAEALGFMSVMEYKDEYKDIYNECKLYHTKRILGLVMRSMPEEFDAEYIAELQAFKDNCKKTD